MSLRQTNSTLTDIYPVSPTLVATAALFGATMAYSAQLMFRCIANRMEQKNLTMRILKTIMAATMLIKTAIFSAILSKTAVNNCFPLIYAADSFYHLSMVAGMTILLLRVQTVMPFGWDTYIKSMHAAIIVLRLIVGAVAVILLRGYIDNGCQFQENRQWAPVYTFFDTLVDSYVTVAIGALLTRHVKRMREAMGGSETTGSYTSIVIQNVARTTVLAISNIISIIFMLTGVNLMIIIVYWPITNTLFILLIGYDVNLVQVVRHLRERMLSDSQNRRNSTSLQTQHNLQLDNLQQHCGLCSTISEPSQPDYPSKALSTRSLLDISNVRSSS